MLIIAPFRKKAQQYKSKLGANFPFLKEICEFDFSFQPSLDKSKIMDLLTLRFIEKAENIIFCGTPGVGKTNLAVSIGIEAVNSNNN